MKIEGGTGLTAAERRVLSRWVRKYAPLLASPVRVLDLLGGVDTQLEEVGVTTLAAITVNLPYRRATVVVTRDFWTESPEMQERVVAHELAHIRLAPLRDLFHKAAAHLPDGEGKAFLAWWQEAEEGVASDLGDAMVEAVGPD